jgi:hypothetical protein
VEEGVLWPVLVWEDVTEPVPVGVVVRVPVAVLLGVLLEVEPGDRVGVWEAVPVRVAVLLGEGVGLGEVVRIADLEGEGVTVTENGEGVMEAVAEGRGEVSETTVTGGGTLAVEAEFAAALEAVPAAICVRISVV